MRILHVKTSENVIIPKMTIDQNIKAYDALRDELENAKNGQWVLMHDCKLIDTYDSFESAAEVAVRLFGSGPYLIRQIGAPAMILPASVAFQSNHG